MRRILTAAWLACSGCFVINELDADAVRRQPEICDNRVDDNLDELVDCEDPRCARGRRPAFAFMTLSPLSRRTTRSTSCGFVRFLSLRDRTRRLPV
jgi:hypothetical protein